MVGIARNTKIQRMRRTMRYLMLNLVV